MPKKGCYEDLLGKRFGRLVVINYKGQQNRRRTMWECMCECGKTVIVDASHLKSNHTTSCGCKVKETAGMINFKNGLSTSRLGRIYYNMINRCYRENNPEYYLYGGRGIQVCGEWKNKETGFIKFCEWALANGYNEKLSIDRVDNNSNYSPANCRWADVYTQANNKRNNRNLIIDGEIDTIGNWSRRLNISYWNLWHYSKGGKNRKYPELRIEVVQNEPKQL